MYNISIIGLGYVGLPLALAISESGKYSVTGYDVSGEHIAALKQAKCNFDPELNKKLKDCKINFSDQQEDLTKQDTYIICVPTPVKNKYEPNLQPLISALEIICTYITKNNCVIIESTINPGVCDEIAIPLIEEKTNLKINQDFSLAHCPERINPGDTKWTVYNIPRNVGASSSEACKDIADFYRSFLDAKINEVSSIKIAEATKILENTFRDINIAYVNELAKSFDLLGIDLVETIQAASNKPFAFMPHYPGCGVGGHCIPVDPYYLIAKAQHHGFDHKFLKMARTVNHSMPKYTIQKTIKALNSAGLSVKDTKILLYGLSYKANVGDLRESPALEIQKALQEWEADLMFFDPYLKNHSNIDKLEDAKDCVALVIATGHQEILNTDLNLFPSLKLIIDGRNVIDMKTLPEHIAYYGIGRSRE